MGKVDLRVRRTVGVSSDTNFDTKSDIKTYF